MAKVIVVLYSYISVVTHAARTRQGQKSSFQADLSTDEVTASGCPHGSQRSGGLCLCDQVTDVCMKDGSFDCPRGVFDFPDQFSSECEGCTCVAAKDICKGGGAVTKSWHKESGFHCECKFDEMCTRGGTLSCPPAGEDFFGIAHSTYPTDCEDCQCVPENDVCRPEESGATWDFGKCKCGGGQTCTRDDEFRNCGVQWNLAQFEPECTDCHCVSDGLLGVATCPSASGAVEEHPFEAGDCNCDFDSYCSTDGGVSANCPSYWNEFDNQHFHHWCKNCKCYPNSKTSTRPAPKAPCPDFATSWGDGICSCPLSMGKEGKCTQPGREKGCNFRGIDVEGIFDSSCDDCTCS